MSFNRRREPGLGAFAAAGIVVVFLNLLWIAAVVGVIALVLSIAGVI